VLLKIMTSTALLILSKVALFNQKKVKKELTNVALVARGEIF
jgi:hypothetical protein